jgi:hypothetical protein
MRTAAPLSTLIKSPSVIPKPSQKKYASSTVRVVLPDPPEVAVVTAVPASTPGEELFRPKSQFES